MFHLVAGFLRAQGWRQWSVAQIETDSLVWWIFAPGATAPTIVGKWPRTALDVKIARRETVALAALSPHAGALNVPRLLFQAELEEGHFLFLQSGLSGVPLSDKGNHFEVVLPWLERFQASVPQEVTLGAAFCDAVEFARRRLADLTPGESALLAAAEQAAPRMASLPATAVHGDFWTGNLLRDGERLAVVDWSNFHSGSPLEDLHHFAAAQGYESRGGNEQRMQSMWRVFFGEIPLMRQTREATARILEERGIPRDLLQPLFVLFLVNRIACIEFSNHAAWRRFAGRYVEAKMPVPFTTS